MVWDSFQVIQSLDGVSGSDSVAEDVLSSFGISFVGSAGGYLNNVDIKRADAFSSLKASLLEEYAKQSGSSLIEVRINEDGEAEFYEVGGDSADIDPYYTIMASSYVRPKVGVSVTGAKPQQERIIYDWYPVIGGDGNYTIYDTTQLASTCYISNFTTHATITYEDPLRNTQGGNWNNGIQDIFELDTPFDRFIGFSWRITPPSNLVTPFTKIYSQSQSSIPVLLTDPGSSIAGSPPNIGTLLRRKVIAANDSSISDCFMFDTVEGSCSSSSVPLTLLSIEGLTYETLRGTTVSKFLGVQGVYAIGIPLNGCMGFPRDDQSALLDNVTGNTALCVQAYSTNRAVVKLNESIHFAVLFSAEEGNVDGLPCIQFANNLRYNDYAAVGTDVEFFIDVHNSDLLNMFELSNPARGTILPLENNNGVLIEQVWAQVGLETPCFVVIDPVGNAVEIAKGLTVEVLAMALRDLPSPIAINGTLVDQTDGIIDSDPTTTQDLAHTAMEEALLEMSSGRTISLTMASLSEGETVRLSEKLYTLLSKDNGKVYSHTCPPTDEPRVGERGDRGGIINVIEYSYTDEGSYLINVTEGPEYFGDFSGIDGGIHYKQTEDVSTKGTIIQDLGNHVQYLVHVDGYGPILAINGCASVLAVRDRVSIRIHNNAVES